MPALAVAMAAAETGMGANAVIWYDASSSTSPSLILDNTHIHACSDTMWQGIYVNSRNIHSFQILPRKDFM